MGFPFFPPPPPPYKKVLSLVAGGGMLMLTAFAPLSIVSVKIYMGGRGDNAAGGLISRDSVEKLPIVRVNSRKTYRIFNKDFSRLW